MLESLNETDIYFRFVWGFIFPAGEQHYVFDQLIALSAVPLGETLPGGSGSGLDSGRTTQMSNISKTSWKHGRRKAVSSGAGGHGLEGLGKKLNRILEGQESPKKKNLVAERTNLGEAPGSLKEYGEYLKVY